MITTVESTISQETLAECVRGLVGGIPDHPAISNEFYDRRTPAAAGVRRTVHGSYMNASVMVALSVLNTENLEARVECVRNLYSEYGNGDASKAHLVPLENFFADMLSRASGATVTSADMHAAERLPTTAAFSAGQRELFTSDDQRTVQGALMAQEHLAYSTLNRLYEGTRNYKHLYDNDDAFHEACEYFYIHIGEAEKEHKAEAIAPASAVCQSEADFDVVAAGFNRFMDLTARYWAGVNTAMLQAG
ncbi:MAG: iron-containing redox enzyme family protein [Pseudonocardiaceae bacterium]